MKKLYSFIVISLFSASVFAQCTAITMCPQITTYTGMVRGYYFVAPVNFTICGLFVPTDASTAAQSIEVVRFATAPPAYPATTNNFSSLFYTASNASATMIPCSIPILMGDTIGVYGARDVTTINSYIMPNCIINILGNSVTIYRSGMQFSLYDQQMHDIFSVATGNPASVIMYTDPTASVNDIAGGAVPLSVYPNPSSGLFSISSAISKGEAHVYNLLGEEVYQSGITANISEIDLRQQPKGVYFLRVSNSEGGMGTAKLVVE